MERVIRNFVDPEQKKRALLEGTKNHIANVLTNARFIPTHYMKHRSRQVARNNAFQNVLHGALGTIYRFT